MNINRNLKIPICNILLTCSILSGVSNCIASDVTGKEVFNSIKNRERVIKSDISKTATFKILTQAAMFDPNQGRLLKNCDATWENNNVTMKIVYDYLQDPVYVPPSSTNYAYQSIDYDKDKRLIVWRFLETYIVSTPEKTEVLDKLQHLYVSPNGAIEKSGGTHTAKHVFHANSNVDGNGDFKYFLLAASFGFSDYIDVNNIELAKMPDGNSIEINSRGTFGKDAKGKWKLTVDSSAGYFVREASFTGEGFNKPSIEVSTSGIVKKDGLEYAREGHIVFSGSSVRDYIDIDVSVRNNQELRQEVDLHFRTPLTSGSEILDFNEGKPTHTSVK